MSMANLTDVGCPGGPLERNRGETRRMRCLGQQPVPAPRAAVRYLGLARHQVARPLVLQQVLNTL